MAYTATTRFGKWLEEHLEPWMTEDLARLADAYGQPMQLSLELAEEEGEDGTAAYVPAWSKMLNPVTCPSRALGYLGNYIGVEIPKTATEAEARELIKREAGLERGTLKSIEEAIKSVIGATKFTIKERTGPKGEANIAYYFLVQVPLGKASAALTEAIEAVVPAGVFFTVEELKGQWLAGTKKWENIAAGVKWSGIKEGEY